jgi:hypothetical protein
MRLVLENLLLMVLTHSVSEHIERARLFTVNTLLYTKTLQYPLRNNTCEYSSLYFTVYYNMCLPEN